MPRETIFGLRGWAPGCDRSSRVTGHDPYLAALRFEALTRFYDPVIAASTRERTFKARVADLAAPREGDRVLDVGCGTGTLALALGRRAPGAILTGVDADDAMLDRARVKAQRAGVGVEFRRAMAQSLPFADGGFDLAVSSLFFHHLRHDEKLVVAREVVRVLEPGGRLVLADWGAPRDPLMRVASQAIRLLDGAGRTADNLGGRLPAILAAAGLGDVVERDRLRTPFGVIAILSARAPG